MKFRNAAYNKFGSIDCEIEHPVYGWIPFTLDKNDKGAGFDVKAIHDEMMAAGVTSYLPDLGEMKAEKKEQIRAAFEVNSTKPVIALGLSWHGGIESALKLDAARRLALEAGETGVEFFDTSNQGHLLTMADAKTVALMVGGAYQVEFGNKQTLMVQVDQAETLEALEAIPNE